MINTVEATLDRLGYRLATWQAGAVVLVLAMVGVVLASLLVHPVDGTEQLFAGSTPFGEGCAFYNEYGFGCMGCGMTRSWVYAVRGDVFTALSYNAAGASLFYGIVAGGVLSAFRLLRRKYVMRIPWSVLIGGASGWGLIWVGLFLLRWQGFMSLPTLN